MIVKEDETIYDGGKGVGPIPRFSDIKKMQTRAWLMAALRVSSKRRNRFLGDDNDDKIECLSLCLLWFFKAFHTCRISMRSKWQNNYVATAVYFSKCSITTLFSFLKNVFFILFFAACHSSLRHFSRVSVSMLSHFLWLCSILIFFIQFPAGENLFIRMGAETESLISRASSISEREERLSIDSQRPAIASLIKLII